MPLLVITYLLTPPLSDWGREMGRRPFFSFFCVSSLT
jgi:hypothetical protein